METDFLRVFQEAPAALYCFHLRILCMKALACVNSKAEKVAGIVVNSEPNRLGMWLGKDSEC